MQGYRAGAPEIRQNWLTLCRAAINLVCRSKGRYFTILIIDNNLTCLHTTTSQ
jgi:hypothetical protein